jgi:hypothetical protein
MLFSLTSLIHDEDDATLLGRRAAELMRGLPKIS